MAERVGPSRCPHGRTARLDRWRVRPGEIPILRWNLARARARLRPPDNQNDRRAPAGGARCESQALPQGSACLAQPRRMGHDCRGCGRRCGCPEPSRGGPASSESRPGQSRAYKGASLVGRGKLAEALSGQCDEAHRPVVRSGSLPALGHGRQDGAAGVAPDRTACAEADPDKARAVRGIGHPGADRARAGGLIRRPGRYSGRS